MLLLRFCLTKWAPQANILRFYSDTKRVLPYKMSAAGENFYDPRLKCIPEMMFWEASGCYFSFLLKISAFLEGPTLRIPPCFRSGTNKGGILMKGGILNIIYPDLREQSIQMLSFARGNVPETPPGGSYYDLCSSVLTRTLTEKNRMGRSQTLQLFRE